MSLSSCSDKNKLTMSYGTMNSNDFEIYLSIFPEFQNKLIYKEGIYYDIPNEYGENDWIITYKGELQCKFRHFKTNRRHSHQYLFSIYEEDTLYCDIDIRGKNNIKNTLLFIPINEDNTK